MSAVVYKDRPANACKLAVFVTFGLVYEIGDLLVRPRLVCSNAINLANKLEF